VSRANKKTAVCKCPVSGGDADTGLILPGDRRRDCRRGASDGRRDAPANPPLFPTQQQTEPSSRTTPTDGSRRSAGMHEHALGQRLVCELDRSAAELEHYSTRCQMHSLRARRNHSMRPEPQKGQEQLATRHVFASKQPDDERTTRASVTGVSERERARPPEQAEHGGMMGGEMPAPVPAPMIGRPFAQIGRWSELRCLHAHIFPAHPCPPRSATDATLARVCVRALRSPMHAFPYIQSIRPVRTPGTVGETSPECGELAIAIRLVARRRRGIRTRPVRS
jgi:hypothetical protein